MVTRNQVSIIHAIGTGLPFNFGKMVFDLILQFADGGCKGMKLPFPSLIYGILVSQGFIRHINEDCLGANEILKIAPAYFKGKRKIDLSWNGGSSAPVMDTIAASSSAPVSTEYVMLSTTYIQSQIDFRLAQIDYAKAHIRFFEDHIRHYEDQIADHRLLLEVGIYSSQKGGEQGKNDEDVGDDLQEVDADADTVDE